MSQYAKDCLVYSLCGVTLYLLVFISVFIAYKIKKIGKKEFVTTLCLVGLFTIVPSVLDFKFYYEYHNNSTIEDVIEIKNVSIQNFKSFTEYFARKRRIYTGTNSVQVVYSGDSRKFLLQENSMDSLKSNIGIMGKYSITYIKTGRHNVITDMVKVG